MGTLVYGGSFNPLHSGHMRIAIEAFEMLAKHLDVVEFVPAGHPPHKSSEGLLPFSLRVEMTRCTLEGMANMRCNDIEGRLPAPSYTYDTIHALRQTGKSGKELYFLLGSQDYALLPTWHKGLQLPRICNLAIVPRGEFGVEEFINLTNSFWPGCQRDIHMEKTLQYAGKAGVCMRLTTNYAVFFLPATWLDISASFIRELWLSGRNVEYLVPPAVFKILEKERPVITECWREKN